MSLSPFSYGIYMESRRFNYFLLFFVKRALPLLSEDRGPAARHAFSYIIYHVYTHFHLQFHFSSLSGVYAYSKACSTCLTHHT
jgi:hypothetical protein